nr:hypothetical protein [Tanacetum cinerariifolium]
DENSFAYDSTPNFVNDSPNVFNPPPQPSTDSYEFCGNDVHYSHDCPPQVLLLAWDRVSEIKDAFRNKQYKPKDVQKLLGELFNDMKNIHEELAEYINTLSWNHPALYNYDDDDDKDYTIAITPEDPVDSLITEDEHLDTIQDFSDSNEDSTSIDDDYFSIDHIDYVEASPLDSELVSLEEVEDDIVCEKLLNIHLLIAKIESLNENPTLDRMLKSSSPFSIPTFSDHPEEKSSGGTTTHADYSLPKYDSFLFEIEPDQGELTSVVMEDILGEPRSEPDPRDLTSIIDFGIRENVLSITNVNLSPEDDQSPLFAYVVWILLPFLTYPVVPPNLISSGNKDTIFNPGISIYRSLLSGISH